MAYKHGAFGEIIKSKAAVVPQADTVLLYVGVAPIHLIKDYKVSDLVNKPIRLKSLNEVQNLVGLSSNWEKFSLCEAFTEHFNNTVANSGPIYIINVLNPDIHRGSKVTLQNVDFSKGYVYIDTDEAIIDTVVVTGKTKDVDYTVDFDSAEGKVAIKALTTLGATETVEYYPVDVSGITKSTIIGSSSADGTVTGIQAIKLLYPNFNAVCNLLVCPGWSQYPEVYQAMVSAVQKINGHWDGYVVADIPVEEDKTETATVENHEAVVEDPELVTESVVVKDGNTVGVLGDDYTLNFEGGELTITLLSGGALYSATSLTVEYAIKIDTKEKAIAWKDAHGYTAERSKVCWPMKDFNGQIFHTSTVFAAEMLVTDLSHNNIPFESPSNKPIMATNQYFGKYSKNPGYDQSQCNDLNENGISTICYWDGKWITWGPHGAAYKFGISMDARGVFDVSLRMLMFLTNNFQLRHAIDIDTPMTPAKKDSILAMEQEELDRLKGIGALIGNPVITFLPEENSTNDMMSGDFVFDIDATPVPPLKSLTAKVAYTDEGFSAFFGEEE